MTVCKSVHVVKVNLYRKMLASSLSAQLFFKLVETSCLTNYENYLSTGSDNYNDRDTDRALKRSWRDTRCALEWFMCELAMVKVYFTCIFYRLFVCFLSFS